MIIIVSLTYLQKMNAQLAPNPYAGAVYYYDFGQGDENPATIGPQLPANITSYKYSTDLCPDTGQYTIARHTNISGCYGNSWVQIATDHTPNGAGLGMGMIFKTGAHLPIVFVDTVAKAFCPSQIYEFSAAILNLTDKNYCPGSSNVPIFRLQVESDDGTIIALKQYQVPSYYPDPPYPLPWWRSAGYSVDFTMPANVNRLVVKVITASSYANCGDAFALDDIAITTVGPPVSILFDNVPPTTLIESACFQQNKEISMSGTMGPFYPDPALQWQQSTDNAKTWTDIPGATQNTYTNIFSTPDTFFFRLTGSDASLIANPACRVFSNNIEVNIDGLPSGYKLNNNSPVCSGNDITFNVSGDESAFIWTGPNGFYDNSAFPHIFHSKLSDSGTYYVQIFTQGGCEKTDSVHITVIGTDVFAMPTDTLVCLGSPIQLNASEGSKYQWDPASNLSSADIQNPIATPTQTTKYLVTVYDKSGCSDTAAVLVRIKNKIPVKAMIQASDYLCPIFDSVSFKDMSTGEISHWLWNFDNGKTDTTKTPSIQNYSTAGNAASFTIKLTVADTSGCSDSTTHLLTVVPNCYIAVPSAFTPNGDGKNDYLHPLNLYKATNIKFRVFNRYGQLMFESHDLNSKWDGTIGGLNQPAGTYVWMLEYNDEKNEKISLKGTTILIR